MVENTQGTAPRIHNWALAVQELDSLLHEDFFWLTQNEQMQRKVSAYKCVLLGIYEQFWAKIDIGYPNLLEIVKRWDEAEIRGVVVQNPIEAIRMMEIVFMSIRLDIAVEKFNQDFKTPDSAEKEMLMGTGE